MTGKAPSWRAIADLLAERMYHQSHCGHPETAAPELPCCRDRAAYRAWEAKSGRTHRDLPYDGATFDVFEASRQHMADARRRADEGRE